jgi:exonuclease V gamma subunit
MNVLARRGETVPVITSLLGETPWTIQSVDDAEAQLIQVCEFYQQTIMKPQPLFRRSGCAWLKELGNRPHAEVDEQTRDKAWHKARDEWEPMNALPGQPTYKKESEQASSLLCWPNRTFDDATFAAEFADCAERMLLPFKRACVGVE